MLSAFRSQETKLRHASGAKRVLRVAC